MQKELDQIVDNTPTSLYTFVTCNRGKVKDLLFQGTQRDQSGQQDSIDPRDAEGSTFEDSACEKVTTVNFVIHIPATEFEDLLTFREHKITKRNKKVKRQVVRLKEG